MSGKTSLPDKPYVFGFNSGRLVMVVCAVLVLMALSIMLGIRIEKYQRPYEALAPEATPSVPAPVTAEPAQQLPEAEPSPAPAVPPSASPTTPAPAVMTPGVSSEKPAAASAAPAPAPEAPKQAVPAPAAQPKPAVAIPQKPKVAEPPPAPKPQPASAAPAPKPEPKPASAAPASKPEPKPVAVAPSPKPEPAKPAVPPAKKEISKTQYAIQVSASRDKSMAVAEAEILKQKGFPSYVEETGGAGKLYRVKIGPFPSEAEANKVKSQLIKDSRFANAYIRPLGSK
ncbi:SPOR domain-containing protein [Candidatus Poribacteria bacterium]|nr:SPOR domain-containing protein [Candidatus Poribacteria bacterium]